MTSGWQGSFTDACGCCRVLARMSVRPGQIMLDLLRRSEREPEPAYPPGRTEKSVGAISVQVRPRCSRVPRTLMNLPAL